LVPVTHPPQPLDGYIVGDSILTPGEESNYTYPPALKKDLLSAVPEFRIRPYEYLHHRPALIKEIIHYVEQQGRAACWLMENHPTDFTMVVFSATDVIQHRFWKYMDPASPLYATREGQRVRPMLWSFYERIDHVIGKLVALAGPDAVTILVSDHGFTSPHRVFFVNRWLYEQGLLHFVSSGTGRLREHLVNWGLTQARFFGLLKKMDILNLRQRLRGRSHFAVGMEVRQGIQRAIAPQLDWSRSYAYAGNVGEPYIYINLQGRDPMGIVKPGEEYEQLCATLCSKLAGLRDPASGRLVLRKVHRAAELYPGPYTHEAPDIVLEFDDPSLVTSDAVQVDTVFQDDRTYRGAHDPYGILLLHGPGIRQSAQIEGARIVDVMPTVLHLLGVPLPRGLDGHVLTEALSAHFLDHNPVRYATVDLQERVTPEAAVTDSYTDEESSEIEQRLRDLGYIT
jgi:predicted AlkP superfamily phosphohydrolase/phosphomutase